VRRDEAGTDRLLQVKNPPNKDVGEGLNTAFEAMQRLRLKPATVVESEQFRCGEDSPRSLATPEQSVMDYLENHDEIEQDCSRIDRDQVRELDEDGVLPTSRQRDD